MLNYFKSLGASSQFEKNRLILTVRTLESPDESALKKLLNTFRGQDAETRSQIAFAIIVTKIQTSNSNHCWIYLLRNLIILDSVLQNECFADQIAQLRLPVVESFYETDAKYQALRVCEIVRNYWKLIKANAAILRTKKSILCFPKRQRSEFLNTLSPREIINEIESLNNFFSHCFVLVNLTTSKQGVQEGVSKAIWQMSRTGLVSYFLLGIMYKLITYYSCEMLCVNKIVLLLTKQECMEIIDLEAVRSFREKLVLFKSHSNRIVAFLEQNKDLKGFEGVSYQHLDPMPGNKLLESLDKYILQRINFDENSQGVREYVPESGRNIAMAVRLKPESAESQRSLSLKPRKKLAVPPRVEQSSNNPFNNWTSSFSEDFPQKQIMTVDLIMTLKEHKHNQPARETEDQPVMINERQTCTINEVIQFPEHICFQRTEPLDLSHSFANIFSGLASAWTGE